MPTYARSTTKTRNLPILWQDLTRHTVCSCSMTTAKYESSYTALIPHPSSARDLTRDAGRFSSPQHCPRWATTVRFWEATVLTRCWRSTLPLIPHSCRCALWIRSAHVTPSVRIRLVRYAVQLRLLCRQGVEIIWYSAPPLPTARLCRGYSRQNTRR